LMCCEYVMKYVYFEFRMLRSEVSLILTSILQG
jgi:hypothetical protein